MAKAAVRKAVLFQVPLNLGKCRLALPEMSCGFDWRVRPRIVLTQQKQSQEMNREKPGPVVFFFFCFGLGHF